VYRCAIANIRSILCSLRGIRVDALILILRTGLRQHRCLIMGRNDGWNYVSANEFKSSGLACILPTRKHMAHPSETLVTAVPSSSAVTRATETTLTLIEVISRRVISVQSVENRRAALEIFRKAGSGHDAHISTPRYDELILCM